MYLIESMVEMGLQEGQEFPSEDHRTVAVLLTIGNKYVTCRDAINNVVQAVIRVPQDRIRTVTPEELYSEFECPPVW